MGTKVLGEAGGAEDGSQLRSMKFDGNPSKFRNLEVGSIEVVSSRDSVDCTSSSIKSSGFCCAWSDFLPREETKLEGDQPERERERLRVHSHCRQLQQFGHLLEG